MEEILLKDIISASSFVVRKQILPRAVIEHAWEFVYALKKAPEFRYISCGLGVEYGVGWKSEQLAGKLSGVFVS